MAGLDVPYHYGELLIQMPLSRCLGKLSRYGGMSPSARAQALKAQGRSTPRRVTSSQVTAAQLQLFGLVTCEHVSSNFVT